jgi:hypothetical protein
MGSVHAEAPCALARLGVNEKCMRCNFTHVHACSRTSAHLRAMPSTSGHVHALRRVLPRTGALPRRKSTEHVQLLRIYVATLTNAAPLADVEQPRVANLVHKLARDAGL